MVYCMKCGHVAKSQDHFCTFCGAPLPAGSKQPAQTVTVRKKKKLLKTPTEISSFNETVWQEQPPLAENEIDLSLWEESHKEPVEKFTYEENEPDEPSLSFETSDYLNEKGNTVYTSPMAQNTPYDSSCQSPGTSWLEGSASSQKCMSVGKYLSSLIFMFIPVIGFILSIVWASGESRFKERVNFARAYLLLVAIVVCIGIMAVFTIYLYS